MNLKCLFGSHSWDGSKCSRCGKTSLEEESRFLKATTEGNCADVEIRLKASPGLALCKDIHGNTPLHLAAEGDHVAVAQLLISHKADVNAKNHHGNTPLYVAVRNDNEGVGRFLVEAAEVGIMTSFDAATGGRRFGLPSKWDGDQVVLKALDIAKMSGSHRMAACLHRTKASLHRVKAEHLTTRANMFVKLNNEAVAQGGAGGLHQSFAMQEAREAQEEYHKAQEEVRAADNEVALSVNASKNSKSQAE